VVLVPVQALQMLPQGVQLVEPAGENCPPRQLVQEVAGAVEYVFAAHCTHEVPLILYPPIHVIQLVGPEQVLQGARQENRAGITDDRKMSKVII
jgi:hypothetical protein